MSAEDQMVDMLDVRPLEIQIAALWAPINQTVSTVGL